MTIEHLQAFEAVLQAPLGAILLAAVKFPTPTPRTAKLHALAREAIRLADDAAAAIQASRAKQKQSKQTVASGR